MHGEPNIDIELEPDEGDSVAAASPANLDLTVEDDRYSRLRLIPWWDRAVAAGESAGGRRRGAGE